MSVRRGHRDQQGHPGHARQGEGVPGDVLNSPNNPCATGQGAGSLTGSPRESFPLDGDELFQVPKRW